MSVIHSDVVKEMTSKPILIYLMIGIIVAITSLTAAVIYGNDQDDRREIEAKQIERKNRIDDIKRFNAPLQKF